LVTLALLLAWNWGLMVDWVNTLSGTNHGVR
jgi:hypothetical protein